MQYSKDANSPLAELFLEIEALVCKYVGDDIQKKYSKNITTYFSSLGSFCYIKTYDDYVHIGWFRGVHIEDSYNLLSGSGKTIRAQKIKKLTSTTKKAIKYYIEETIVYLIEHEEMKLMRKALSKKNKSMS